MDGGEPLFLFLGVVAVMAAFALVKTASRGRRDARGRLPARRPFGRSADRRGDRVIADSSRGPDGTDSGAGDGGASMRGD
jgi:hypothetical protein